MGKTQVALRVATMVEPWAVLKAGSRVVWLVDLKAESMVDWKDAKMVALWVYLMVDWMVEWWADDLVDDWAVN